MGGVEDVLQQGGEAERERALEAAVHEACAGITLERVRGLVYARRTRAHPDEQQAAALEHGQGFRARAGRPDRTELRDARAYARGGEAPAVVGALERAVFGKALRKGVS